MTEPKLTEQDFADLEALGAKPEDVTPRTILEIWREVLSNIEVSRAQPIPGVVAHKVVSTWPKLSYQDTVEYYEQYHDILVELREVLHDLLAEHPDALQFTGITADGQPEDLVENSKHYQDLLVSWNLVLEKHELDWRAGAPDSHISIAALIDAREFFFARTGLTGHLDTIGFQLSDEDFMAALEAARAAQNEEG